MERKVRIAMYVLSISAVAAVIVAMIWSGSGQGSRETAGVFYPETETAEPEQQQETESVRDTEVWAETEEPEEPETEQPEDVTLLFTGDVLFAKAFQSGYDAQGIAGVIDDALLRELNEADILMVNNEFPFSDRGTPMPDKQFTFRSSPSYVSALQEMGVDVVSLANNHTLDYGKEALTDTFDTLDGAGILYGGAGDSVERAEEVQVIEAGGKRFGFLAVSRVIPTGDWKVENSTPGLFSCYDDTRLLELIAEARENCDFVVVYPHWGVEYQAYPEEYQVEMAERWTEAGADLIVGAHTHCLQGVSFFGDAPVFYSLGNFVFGREIDRSAILKVTVQPDGAIAYRLLPVYAAGGITYLADGERAERICRYLDDISSGASVGSDGSVMPE